MANRNWNYRDSQARSDSSDDYFRDLGLNPDNPNQQVVGSSGLSMGWGRANNRMLEGLIPHTGAATLYNGADQNDFLALHTGSGSVYDDPMGGGTRQSISAGQSKPMIGALSPEMRLANGYGSPDEVAAYRQRMGTAERTAEKRAYDAKVAQDRRRMQVRTDLPKDLLSVYDRLTPTEQGLLDTAPPEARYARLASHPIRQSTRGASAATDYLQDTEAGVDHPTIRPVNGTRPVMTSLAPAKPGQTYRTQLPMYRAPFDPRRGL